MFRTVEEEFSTPILASVFALVTLLSPLLCPLDHAINFRQTLLSVVITRSPSNTWITTLGWWSAKVVNVSFFSVGTAVFRSISLDSQRRPTTAHSAPVTLPSSQDGGPNNCSKNYSFIQIHGLFGSFPLKHAWMIFCTMRGSCKITSKNDSIHIAIVDAALTQAHFHWTHGLFGSDPVQVLKPCLGLGKRRIDDVEILTSQVCVTRRRLHFEQAILNRQDRNVRSAATHIVNQHVPFAIFFLVQSARQRWRRRFADDF